MLLSKTPNSLCYAVQKDIDNPNITTLSNYFQYRLTLTLGK